MQILNAAGFIFPDVNQRTLFLNVINTGEEIFPVLWDPAFCFPGMTIFSGTGTGSDRKLPQPRERLQGCRILSGMTRCRDQRVDLQVKILAGFRFLKNVQAISFLPYPFA